LFSRLKCNRQQPCQNCTVRREPALCVFAGSENRPAPAPAATVEVTQVHVENMQQRIDRLENLVTSLVAQKNDEIELAAATDTTQLDPDDFEADQLIKMYQEDMAVQSPFVIIPPGTTASDLRIHQPLLYKAVIMATSSYHPSRQALYEKQVVEFVTERVLIRNEKTLELLQGVLLVIGW